MDRYEDEASVVGDYAFFADVAQNSYDCFLFDETTNGVIDKNQTLADFRQVIRFIVDEHTSHISITVYINQKDENGDT